ncbi:MAG: hypothetical protein ACUVRM_09575 [Bacillota bacterium]
MLTGKWELTEEKTDWRGVALYRARRLESGEEYLLEDLALAAPTKERIYRQIALGLEEPIQTAREIDHPALRRPLALTRHGEKYFLVRPMDPLLWEAWGPEPVPADPEELGRWLLTMAEVLAVYHGKGLTTKGIARTDLVRTAAGVLVLEPLCQSYLAAYRDREICTRHEFAPEVAQGKEWGQAADLFALGLNAYLLATRRLPFPGEGAEFIAAILSTQPVDPRAYTPALGPEPAKTILGLLARESQERPTAADLAATLREQAEKGKFVATPAEQEEFARRGRPLVELVERRERFRLFLRRHRVALLVGVGVVAFLVSLFVFRSQPTPTITAKTTPAQVVAAYYRAIEKLDTTLLEETLAPGVARGTVNMVTHLFVIHRVTVAYSGKPLDTPGPLRIKNLRIAQIKRRPPEFIARYDLILERGSGEDLAWEIQSCEDHLRLGRRKDRRVGEKWVIVDLAQKILAKRELKPAPQKESISPSR